MLAEKLCGENRTESIKINKEVIRRHWEQWAVALTSTSTLISDHTGVDSTLTGSEPQASVHL